MSVTLAMAGSDWVDVCHISDLVTGSGVCALVDGQQIALFSVGIADNRQLFAISNWDPIGKANVMYRGLVGSVAEQPMVASPLYKQRYCLNTGRCLDKENVAIPVFPLRLSGHRVELQRQSLQVNTDAVKAELCCE